MKAILKNIFLVLLSIMLTYCAIEFLVFKHVIMRLPLNRHLFLPKPLQSLAQNSKHSLLPEKGYIAIFGDSYAMGYGDWLMSADHNKNAPFNSAHVLHDLTEKDVISFGQSNRGSLDGMVIEPIKKFEYINNLLLFKLPKPGTVLIYFYEGNDLNDNLKLIMRKYTGKYDLERIYDQDYFKSFIDDYVQKATSFKFYKNFIFGSFIKKMIAENMDNLFGIKEETEEEEEEEKIELDFSDEINRAIAGGKELTLPSSLQGPELGINNEQMKLALYVLDQSLRYIRGYFNESKFVVVYIPSVLSSYTIVSKMVRESKSGGRVYSTEEMLENSNYIAAKVKELTVKNGMRFVDTRDDIRKAARAEIIHGPNDWKHFNRIGYHALAGSIFSELKRTGEAF